MAKRPKESYLLDTHAAIWLALDSDRLSTTARAALGVVAPENLFLSVWPGSPVWVNVVDAPPFTAHGALVGDGACPRREETGGTRGRVFLVWRLQHVDMRIGMANNCYGKAHRPLFIIQLDHALHLHRAGRPLWELFL